MVKDSAQSLPALLPLTECFDLPVTVVGTRTLETLLMLEDHLPMPPALVIPTGTLEQIAQHNNFFRELKKVFTNIDWRNKIDVQDAAEVLQKKILSFSWPTSLTKEFMETYEAWFEHKYVAVRPSPLSSKDSLLHLSELHIKGEANLIESILKVWAKLYDADLLSHRRTEWENTQTIPTAILLQEMIPAEVSGWALTHIHEGRHHIALHATWGISEHLGEEDDHTDQFVINTKSWSIVSKQIRLKKYQYKRELDQVKQVPVTPAEQTSPCLTDEGVIALAQYIERIKKYHPHPHRIEWAIAHNVPYLLGMSECSESEANALQPEISLPEETEEKTENDTGIHPVIIVGGSALSKHQLGHQNYFFTETERILEELRVHPKHLIKQGKSESVVKRLAQYFGPLFKSQSKKKLTLFYQTHGCTSHDLLELSHADLYESPERNPFLGYRGAARIARDFAFFDVELHFWQEMVAQYPQLWVNMVIPFVRTPEEFAVIKKHVLHHFPVLVPRLQLWIECDVPANISTLSSYLVHRPAGVIFHLPHLTSLLNGIDPGQQDLAHRYDLPVTVLQSVLAPAAQTILSQKIPGLLAVAEPSRSWSEWAKEYGLLGVCTPVQRKK